LRRDNLAARGGIRDSISGENKMKCGNPIQAVAAMLLGLAVFMPAEVQAFELSGAWASQSDLCKQVFAKKGKQVVFAEFSDLYGSGFIIDGNRIRGKTANCTIKSRKQEGDSLELSAACATSIMTSNVRFLLKIIDDNSISRTVPDTEGMVLKYSRCSI
jgi:hypothetical protein